MTETITPIQARGVNVSEPPGGSITLSLTVSGVPVAAVSIGPSEAVAIASELLLAARARMGRQRGRTWGEDCRKRPDDDIPDDLLMAG